MDKSKMTKHWCPSCKKEVSLKGEWLRWFASGLVTLILVWFSVSLLNLVLRYRYENLIGPTAFLIWFFAGLIALVIVAFRPVCSICGCRLKHGLTEIQEEVTENLCPNCGAELEEDATFCSKCGNKIEDEDNNKMKEEIYLFSISLDVKADFENGSISEDLKKTFEDNERPLSSNAEISTVDNNEWKIRDGEKEYTIRESGNWLNVYFEQIPFVRKDSEEIKTKRWDSDAIGEIMMEEDEKPPKVKLPEGIKDIKDLAYITSRKLKSANGEETGAVVIWRNKGEDEFHYTLKCPYCGAEEESNTAFKRMPNRVRCSNCGKSILMGKESLASMWARSASFIIDYIVIQLIFFIGGFIGYATFGSAPESTLGLLFGTVVWAIPLLYFPFFFGTTEGQTIGMAAMGIKLYRSDGIYPIGYTRGFLRFIGMIISALPFCLGFIWILFDKNRQGWHDKIAGTYAVVA